MSEIPEWVTSAVGIFAILGSISFLVLIAVAAYLIRVLADLGRQVRLLSGKVERLTDRVQAIADQVHEVTTEVGVRTGGIVRYVDEIAFKSFRTLEMFGPVAMGLFALWRWRRARERS